MIKTPEEIAAMRRGGALLSRALQAAVDAVRPGVRMCELDAIAEAVICEGGGTPSFKGYRGGGAKPFPSTLCISRNDEVVHGLGNREIALEEGDIVGLDIGCWFEELCTDMAISVPVGKISQERQRLLDVTRAALFAGVDAALVGRKVRDISAAIEGSLGGEWGIVRALVGHGVGHAVHEDPHVPNFVSSAFPSVTLKAGMCLALEPMVTAGDDAVQTAADGWTIATSDGSDAAHFEVTIALGDAGPEVLTPLPE